MEEEEEEKEDEEEEEEVGFIIRIYHGARSLEGQNLWILMSHMYSSIIARLTYNQISN